MAKRKLQEQEWGCVFCTFHNSNAFTICDMCGKSKENKKPRVEDDDDNDGGKGCKQCTFQDNSSLTSCEMCVFDLLIVGEDSGEKDQEVDDDEIDNNEENDAKEDSEDTEQESEEEEVQYHPGELEFDHESNTWDDWDERCHGPRDTNSHRSEYPEGFKWSCCDEPAW